MLVSTNVLSWDDVGIDSDDGPGLRELTGTAGHIVVQW